MTEQKEGINVTALREIKLLKELSDHPNIVAMIEAFPLKKNVLLVRVRLRTSRVCVIARVWP